MKYYVEINDTEFSASKLEVTSLHRMESIQNNLVGDLLIDRAGTPKIKLSVTFNLLTEAQMAVLDGARDDVTCKVRFDRGSERIKKTMHIFEYTEPSPIYFFGDKEQGIRYGTVTVQMEEM